jgi:hypothetical protein
MRNGIPVLLSATALAAALATAGAPAWADGALAVGTTGDVVKDGIAFGMVVNESKETAAETAVKRCRTFKARAAADRCKLIATFAGECFAVAYDPQPGTPGAGWGIGADQLAANLKAIAMCEETAGPARKGFCQVESGGCDTTGQREPPKPAAQAPAESGHQGPAKSDSKTPAAANVMKAAPAAPPDRPATPAPAPKAPGKAAERTSGSWLHTNSPLFLVVTMAGVGLAYGLGQLVRGKLAGGVSESQLVVGGGLAVASGVVVKLLDLAGSAELVVLTLAALVALAAAIFA